MKRSRLGLGSLVLAVTFSALRVDAILISNKGAQAIGDSNSRADSGNGQTIYGRVARFTEGFLELLKTILPNFIGNLIPKVVDRSNDKVCYDYVGCFSANDGLTLPVSFPRDPEEVDVTFLLYSRDNRDVPVTLGHLPTSDVESLRQFQESKPLKFIIHGWLETSSEAWVQNTTQALLAKLDCNVLLVDWSKSASLVNYIQASGDTALVGREASLFLQRLQTSHGENISHAHVIGHSLGAQVAGFFARHFKYTTGKLIPRVSALDAAAPLFANTNVSVSKGDAAFLDAIHTSGGDKPLQGEFGILAPIGHVDFYPNGGRKQPGCSATSIPGLLENVFCSHKRSTLLYLESITNTHCHFRSTPCSGGFQAFLEDKCVQQGEPGEMGYYSEEALGRGIQQLDTNGEPEYCIV